MLLNVRINFEFLFLSLLCPLLLRNDWVFNSKSDSSIWVHKRLVLEIWCFPFGSLELLVRIVINFLKN